MPKLKKCLKCLKLWSATLRAGSQRIYLILKDGAKRLINFRSLHTLDHFYVTFISKPNSLALSLMSPLWIFFKLLE